MSFFSDTSVSCANSGSCAYDTQCCDGFVCIFDQCINDIYDGNPASFGSMSPNELVIGTTEYFSVYGTNLRKDMHFKLLLPGYPCESGNDNPFAGLVPNSAPGLGREDSTVNDALFFNGYIGDTGGSVQNITVCYAENTASTWKDSGLRIDINESPLPVRRRLLSTVPNFESQITWIQGSSVVFENSSNQTIEYNITLLTQLEELTMDYVYLNPRMEDYFEWPLYPRSCVYYHDKRGNFDCLQIFIDGHDVKDWTSESHRYRDWKNWQKPWNIKIKWWNDGTPEIQDRPFVFFHILQGSFQNNYFDYYNLVNMSFVIKDDDPKLMSNSLFLSGGSDGPSGVVDGTMTGDEGLTFACFGCGDNPDLVRVLYGEEPDRDYYNGQELSLQTRYIIYIYHESYLNFMIKNIKTCMI